MAYVVFTTSIPPNKKTAALKYLLNCETSWFPSFNFKNIRGGSTKLTVASVKPPTVPNTDPKYGISKAMMTVNSTMPALTAFSNSIRLPVSTGRTDSPIQLMKQYYMSLS